TPRFRPTWHRRTGDRSTASRAEPRVVSQRGRWSWPSPSPSLLQKRRGIHIVAAIAVPQRQMLAAAHERRSAPHQLPEQSDHFAGRMRAKLAARRRYRVPQDDDASLLLQRLAERDLLGRVEAFVESARGVEGSTRAEH